MPFITLVTRRNFLAEKARFSLSIAGIALSVFLISFLLSLYQGWNINVGRLVDKMDADVWVALEGSSDFLDVASILPIALEDELAAMPEVDGVDGIIVRPMEMAIGDRREGMHLVAYELDGRAGGPLNIKRGNEAPGPNEIIVDEGFAQKAKVGIGDVMETGDTQLTIVGISTGGNLIFSQTTYVTMDTMLGLLPEQAHELRTFYLLHLVEGADPEVVAAAVEERVSGVDTFPKVGAYSKEEFASATRDRIMRNIIPILGVILGIALIVGVAITGLTIYSATVENEREYGILKAIGFTNGYLFRLVLEQSLATGAIGFVIGVGLTIIASQFVADLVPQFVTLVRWQDVLIVFGTTLIMSMIAAVLPVRRITQVDPVMVFKA